GSAAPPPGSSRVRPSSRRDSGDGGPSSRECIHLSEVRNSQLPGPRPRSLSSNRRLQRSSRRVPPPWRPSRSRFRRYPSPCPPGWLFLLLRLLLVRASPLRLPPCLAASRGPH